MNIRDLDEITIRLTNNAEDGWTAQVVEFPAAISQGFFPSGAAGNVIDALFLVLLEEDE